MNFYKRYPGDYARDTGHLSLTEHGAYGLLLDRYYSTGALPEMKRDLYNLCHASTRAERAAVDKVMAEFFPGGKNHRADKEIAKWNEKAAQNREVGKLGGRPKRNPDGNPDGFEEETQTVTERVSKQNPPRSQIPEEDSERDKSLSGDTAISVDKALYADARKIFGSSIGGQVSKAIGKHGKPWVLGIIEACRNKDPEQARAYLAAAMNGVSKPKEADQRRAIP